MDGDWSTPDLVAVVRLAVRNLDQLDNSNRLFTAFRRIADLLTHRRNRNTQSGSRRNIAYHYDLGNEFYRLFLDRNLAYSCAYYDSVDDTLEQAQIHKFDRICRKLQLSPRDHVLEIGTGWAALQHTAAETYGCRVTTTTISRQQHDYAREVFSQSRARERIELLFEDLPQPARQFDKIVSIEMFESRGFTNTMTTTSEPAMGCSKRTAVCCCQTITIWSRSSAIPEAERLDQETHLSRSGTRLSGGDSEVAGQHDPFATFPHGRHRDALQPHAAGMAPPFSGTSRPKYANWVRRALSCACGTTTWLNCEGAFRERYISDVQLVLSKVASKIQLMNEPAMEPAWQENL